MSTYSDIDIKNLRNEELEDQRRATLKASFDKITQGIADNGARSGERAIWELLQNARDYSGDRPADVTIELDRDNLIFSHHGTPFSTGTIYDLILQQSSKRQGGDTVGQYGTGFMTTHEFSRRVYISGDCQIRNTGVYVPLPKEFCLDRSMEEEESFIAEMESELREIDALFDQINLGHTTPDLNTVFTYPFEREGQAEKISSQVTTTMNLMPFVLVFNDRIEKCTIINHLSGEQVSFSKSARVETVMEYDSSVKVVRNTIVVIKQGGVRGVDIYSLESADGKDRIIIPPLPVGFDDVDAIPSQFIFFPLLGTESFGTGFIFHSERLYPTKDRDSFLLPKENDNMKTKYSHNEAVIDELLSMLFTYYEMNPDAQCIPLGFAKVAIRRTQEEEPDDIRRDFLSHLQTKFVDKFIHWKMIPTEEGFQSIHDDAGIVALSHDIYEGLSEEDAKNFIPTVVSYAQEVYTLPSEDVIGWSRVVYGWNPNTPNYYISLDTICNSIKSKGANLKSFLDLLNKLGRTDLLSTYSLIPNRDGVLHTSTFLKNGKDIIPELYTIAKPILGTRADRLVDPAFSDLISRDPYTRKNLRDDLKAEIDDIRDKTHKLKPDHFRSGPVCLDDSTLVELTVDELIAFCSAFPIENPQNYRANVMKALCKILGKEFKPIVIPAVEPEEADMYGNSFNYLLDDTMLTLSLKDQDWLTSKEDGQEHLANLAAFVKELVNTQDEDKKKRLDDYGIIPNRLFEMCLPKELKKSAVTPIPESVLDLYEELTGIVEGAEISNYRSILVHEDFVDFYSFPECKANDITAKMEEMIREQDEDYSLPKTRTIVLKIIESIDKGEWPDVSIFRDIRDKKTTIFFKNTVSGEKGKHVYALLRQKDDILENLAEMTSHPDFAGILAYAKELIEQRKDEESDFQFKKAIGNHIEALLRERLGDSVGNEDFQFPDVQNGQDIVVFYKNKPIFFIEVKTKWNFTTSGPAYMSKNQVLKACENKDCYALCCVDLTNYDLPDRTYPESLDHILDRIKMKFEIGENLNSLLMPSIQANSSDPENNISIDGDYKARIPAGAFRKGDSFNDLVSRIIEQSNKVKD